VKKAYLSAIFAVSLWGTTFSIAKLVTPTPLSPLTFTMIRTCFGFLSLFTYLILSKQVHSWIEIQKKHFVTLICLGIFSYAISYLLQYAGLALTTATSQAIMSNTQTFWVVIINFVIFKRKPKPIFLFGALLAFLGVFLVVYQDDITISTTTLIGNIISLVSFLSWGAYTAFSKKISTEESPLLVTTSIIFWAAVFLTPLSFAFNAYEQLAQLSSIQWIIILYLGCICVGVTFLCWAFALSDKEIPSENIAIITMLNPIVGIIFAAIILGEQISLQEFIGLCIVLVSVFIAENSKKIK
jgi:drug/metabolite transporter (DMT)-like permease